MKKSHTRSIIVRLILALTLLLGGVYVVVQQSWRQAANEPQASIVKDVARDLADGKDPKSLTTGYVDMTLSMAPFVIVYDQFGKVVAGNGNLNGNVPQVPIGVLAATKNGKINKVTWQPSSEVRIASVSMSAGQYYVLSGRNLSVTEKKINHYAALFIAIWFTVVIVAILVTVWRRKQARTLAEEGKEEAGVNAPAAKK